MYGTGNCYYYYYYYPFLGGEGWGGGKFWYTTFLWTPSLSIQNLPRWKYPTLQDELQVKKNCSCTIINTTLILACIYSQHCSPIHFQGTDYDNLFVNQAIFLTWWSFSSSHDFYYWLSNDIFGEITNWSLNWRVNLTFTKLLFSIWTKRLQVNLFYHNFNFVFSL